MRFKWDWGIAGLVLAAALVLVGAIALTGVPFPDAIRALVNGSLGSKGALSGTLKQMTPLLIAGLAVFVALRAGLFNIGVEGQFLVGALVAAVVALAVPGPLGLLVAILAGALAGGLWALPAGWIKAYRGGHEVITTIMLNSIAVLMTGALVAGPLKAPGQQNTTTRSVSPDQLMPNLYQDLPLRVSSALLVGVLLVIAVAVYLKRTVSGFELELTGANSRAAEFAGVRVRRTTLWAMAVSGALGGLGGGLHVAAYEGRFYAGFSPGYGFDALGVALLCGANPLGLIPAAFFFGALNRGSTVIQIEGVPKGISTVILGLILVVFAVLRYRRAKAVD